MNKRVHYIGLDVHKESIAIALGGDTEVRNYGLIGGTLDALDKVIQKLQQPDIEMQTLVKRKPRVIGWTLVPRVPRERKRRVEPWSGATSSSWRNCVNSRISAGQPSLITLPAPTQQSIAPCRKENREKTGTQHHSTLDNFRAYQRPSSATAVPQTRRGIGCNSR